MFTKTDKALLDRSALRLQKSAAALQSENPVWGATVASKKAKLEYDRLMRDARDLRTLGKRIAPKKVAMTPELPLTGEGGSNG